MKDSLKGENQAPNQKKKYIIYICIIFEVAQKSTSSDRKRKTIYSVATNFQLVRPGTDA